jgi:hypothetical protein
VSEHPIQKEFETTCRRHKETDKVTKHGYHRFYPFFLHHLRERRIRMVEIGVNRRGSLEFWRDYFPDCSFWGVEIKAPQEVEEVHPGNFILRGDQSDPEFLRRLIEIVDGPVDFIIDDGSHVPRHQLDTFNLLFDKQLAPGGCYIVEDIETSYWKLAKLYGYDINCGIGHPKSAVEVFRKIADCCNSEYHNGIRYTPNEPISHATQDQIETVTFAQNAIIVTKKDPDAHGAYYGRKYGRSGMV